MGRPTPNGPTPEGTDPQGAEPTRQSQASPGLMIDQARSEDIRRRSALDAEAVRTAEARIDNAIGAIRLFGDPHFYSAAPELPPTANLSSSRHDAATRPDYYFARIKTRPPLSLDPDVVPPPPNGTRLGSIGLTLVRSALVVGFAAIAAYVITTFSSFQPDGRWVKHANESAAPVGHFSREAVKDTRQLSRLVVEDQQAFANEPVLLAVAVAPAVGDGSLSLGGLARGTRLSAGVPLSEASWELSVRNIGGVYVYAPQNFVGVMSAIVDLLSPTKKIIDSHPMRLEWIAKANASPGPDEITKGTTSADAIKRMDPQEAAALMERGLDLLRNGDIALAQLAFRRLADAGQADAALALANTYDPRYLAGHRFVGVLSNETNARTWYQRASELGSTEADRILRGLDNK